jgi:IS30 family transposase
MGMYSQSHLNEIANKLNTRPRKTLKFKTPAEVLNQVLH